MKFTYLLINIGTILIPLLFSFHPKLNFYKRWKSAFISIVIVGIPFLVWDIEFTKMGVWGFNQKYLMGINLKGLPIEEWLFFVSIPYACMFTYHCFSILIPPKEWVNPKWISAIWMMLLLTLSIAYYDRLYTFICFGLLFLTLGIIQFLYNPKWLSRLYFSLAVLIIPFIIVNGILTGSWIQEPVVWYNSEHIMVPRLLTIPLEDFNYGTLLIVLNVACLEYLKK